MCFERAFWDALGTAYNSGNNVAPFVDREIIVVAQRFCSQVGNLCLPTLVIGSSQTQLS
jgi:hypothetical protein